MLNIIYRALFVALIAYLGVMSLGMVGSMFGTLVACYVLGDFK